MGVIRNIIATIVVCCFFVLSVSAQEKPPVHKINGKKYYLHVVEAGNTVYGISRLYNLSTDEIQEANPILKEEGLKVNQTLLIPVTSENKKELGGVVEQDGNFITYEVQPKETLYAISKKYNTSLDAILNANSSIRDEGLKSGSQIKIPIAEVEEQPEEVIATAKPDSLEAHIVEKGQTLYAISKLYETTVEELKAANPDVTENLAMGMALRIPGTRVEIEEESVPKEEVDSNQRTVHQVDSCSAHYSVGLLFPIEPSFPDSVTRHNFKIDEAQRVGLSFYRGFIHAIDSLAESKGLRFTVRLIPTGADTYAIKEVIKSGQLDSIDVAVGPFYTDQFTKVADHLKQRGVPAICPIPKPSKILFGRPNAIKTTPSESMQLSAMAEFLATNFRDSNLIVVNSNKFIDHDRLEFFKSQYAKAVGVPDTFVNDAIKEIKLWDINHETLSMRLSDSGSYYLIVPTKDKVFVTKLLSELYNLKYETEDMYKFRVFGLEEWEKYAKDLDIQQLHDLRVTLPITGYLDFDDYRVRAYYRQYRSQYGFEPDRFTLIGFDLANYLITQLDEKSNAWFEHPEDGKFKGILMPYNLFRVMEASGAENQSVELFEYRDFRLKEFGAWPLAEKK